MIDKMKYTLEKELEKFVKQIETDYSLRHISPFLAKNIKDFVLREGKRFRPIFFINSYLGFAKKVAPGLYTSALSVELLHNFALIHDDIIDRANLRRGQPALQYIYANYLKNHHLTKFQGQDLALLTGDLIFALAIQSFLAIEENLVRKEKALKHLMRTAIHTCTGEFIELLYGLKDLSLIKKQDIYKIYDLKTAHYSFASPLVSGAILAGAAAKETDILHQYGLYLGRAFQIKDDLISMFGQENLIGKSILSDLQEAKITLLVWYAYHHGDRHDQTIIRNILSKQRVTIADLLKMREVVVSSGTLCYAKKEISSLLKKAQILITSSAMKNSYKNLLATYAQQLITLP